MAAAVVTAAEHNRRIDNRETSVILARRVRPPAHPHRPDLAEGAALPPARRRVPQELAVHAADAHDPRRPRAERRAAHADAHRRGHRRRAERSGRGPGRPDRHHRLRAAGLRAVRQAPRTRRHDRPRRPARHARAPQRPAARRRDRGRLRGADVAAARPRLRRRRHARPLRPVADARPRRHAPAAPRAVAAQAVPDRQRLRGHARLRPRLRLLRRAERVGPKAAAKARGGDRGRRAAAPCEAAGSTGDLRRPEPHRGSHLRARTVRRPDAAENPVVRPRHDAHRPRRRPVGRRRRQRMSRPADRLRVHLAPPPCRKAARASTGRRITPRSSTNFTPAASPCRAASRSASTTTRPSVFADTARFAVEAKIDLPRFAIVTPFPGTPLHRRLDSEGRIFDRDWSRYDGQHAVFRPASHDRRRAATRHRTRRGGRRTRIGGIAKSAVALARPAAGAGGDERSPTAFTA